MLEFGVWFTLAFVYCVFGTMCAEVFADILRRADVDRAVAKDTAVVLAIVWPAVIVMMLVVGVLGSALVMVRAVVRSIVALCKRIGGQGGGE